MKLKPRTVIASLFVGLVLSVGALLCVTDVINLDFDGEWLGEDSSSQQFDRWGLLIQDIPPPNVTDGLKKMMGSVTIFKWKEGEDNSENTTILCWFSDCW